MKSRHILLGCLILLLVLPMTAMSHSYDLNRGQVVTLDEIIRDLASAQAIMIGETHDQKSHHDAQLQIIHELHRADHQVGIGLEMFRHDGQEDLDRWVAGQIDEADFSRVFANHWNNWELYRDIFLFARDNDIPLYGLNISRQYVKQVARHGFASLSEEERSRLPLAVCNVSQEYRDFIRRTLQGHPLEGTAFEHFCEAQILWDASMADNLSKHLQKTPQRTFVVLAGNGHAWKHGIPEQLARFGEYRTRVLLPEVPGQIDLHHTDANATDYLLQGVELGPLH